MYKCILNKGQMLYCGAQGVIKSLTAANQKALQPKTAICTFFFNFLNFYCFLSQKVYTTTWQWSWVAIASMEQVWTKHPEELREFTAIHITTITPMTTTLLLWNCRPLWKWMITYLPSAWPQITVLSTQTPLPGSPVGERSPMVRLSLAFHQSPLHS